jgi:hypothetical protein
VLVDFLCSCRQAGRTVLQRVKPAAVLPVSNCVCRRQVFQLEQEMKRSLKQVNMSRQK